MSDTFYGRGWNEMVGAMMDSISEAEARKRYQSGELFAVAVGEDLYTLPRKAREDRAKGIVIPVPEYAIELWDIGARTTFYTPGRSIEEIHDWDRIGENFFLETVVIYQYPDQERFYGQDQCLISNTFKFKEDGTSRHECRDKSMPMSDIIERRDVPLDGHYEPVPAFGDWTGLGTLERTNPAQARL